MPPTLLREHQHEILTADETRSLVFGTEDTGYLTLTRPVWAGSETRLGDVERSQEDGVMFGRDFQGPKTVSFEMGVLTDRLTTDDADAHRQNLDYMNTLEGWWRDERLRARPWDYACLRSCEAGQTWRAYGRPRRYEEIAGPLTTRGYTPVMADFGLVDNRVYADVEDELTVGLFQPPDGGLVAPLVEPITMTGESSSTDDGAIDVAGTRSTWIGATFYGPVLNPRVVVGGMTIGLNTSIPDGMNVTVDPRPWARGVFRDDGASLAGTISAATPQMKNLLLYPGRHEVVYSGTDATGTSQCRVFWRSARSRP
jgi:hypothetical protein